MICTITYRDTCLSCYVPDHRWVGVCVDNRTTYREVIDGLAEGYANDGFTSDGEEWTDAHEDAFREALSALMAQAGSMLDRAFAPSLKTEDDDSYCESSQAWFTVTFTTED
jgi:hypothetical protein